MSVKVSDPSLSISSIVYVFDHFRVKEHVGLYDLPRLCEGLWTKYFHE